ETNLAGLLHIELASDATAVRADLDEIPDQLLHVGEIGADFVDLSALAGVEARGGRDRSCRGLRLPVEMKQRFHPGGQARAAGLSGRAGFTRGGAGFLRQG